MINKKDYLHKYEEDAFKELEGIVFQKELEKYYCEFIEKSRVPDLLGKTVCASPKQFHKVYHIIKEISEVLEMEAPKCFIYEDFYYGAESKGIEKPWIELSSKTLVDFTEAEVRFLLGKELCNIYLGHTKNYEITSLYLEQLGQKIGSEIIEKSNKASLYKWWRISNYSSDCFGLLACGSVDVAVKVILKTILNSCYLAEAVNVSEYLKQGDAINALQGTVYEDTKLDEKVPYACFRIKNLLSYASSTRGIRAMNELNQVMRR